MGWAEVMASEEKKSKVGVHVPPSGRISEISDSMKEGDQVKDDLEA